MLNSVVQIAMMSAKYFEYYTIILRGAVFSWTHYMLQYIVHVCVCVHVLVCSAVHVFLTEATSDRPSDPGRQTDTPTALHHILLLLKQTVLFSVYNIIFAAAKL